MDTLLKPSWLLHARPYGETSLIVDFLLEYEGRVSIIAHGVRKKRSHKAAFLQPFIQLLISYYGKGSLKTLKDVDAFKPFYLSGPRLFSGLYLNELLMRTGLVATPIDKIFTLYTQSIMDLATTKSLEPILRFFELELLTVLGYLPSLTREAKTDRYLYPDQYYYFIPELGFVAISHVYDKMQPKREHVFLGKSILALALRDFSQPDQFSDFKRFTRQALLIVLGERPLKTRQLFHKPMSYYYLKDNKEY